jgi:hypothetical protein
VFRLGGVEVAALQDRSKVRAYPDPPAHPSASALASSGCSCSISSGENHRVSSTFTPYLWQRHLICVYASRNRAEANSCDFDDE